jgi:hypothetical protein
MLGSMSSMDRGDMYYVMCNIIAGNLYGILKLAMLGSRLGDNMKMCLKEIRCEDVN